MSQETLARNNTYETVLGGKDGPATGITLPMLAENQRDGGKLKWIDDPKFTGDSGPYAQYGVTQGDWSRNVNGQRRQIIVNVQIYGDKDRIMRMAGKTIVGRLEVVIKHTAFGSFVLVNIFECTARAEVALEITSSTKKFLAEEGWDSFATDAMISSSGNQVRVAVGSL